MLARSLLFVPGSRPDRFAKALASGADIVCVDLEDAVAPDAKVAAQEAALAFLAEATEGAPTRAVRMNALGTLQGLRDLAAIAAAAPRHGLLVIPKVEDAAEIRVAAAVLAEAGATLRILPLVETLRGVEAAHAIAASSPLMAGLILGGVDLAAELGVEPGGEGLDHARGRIVHAAHAAGIEAMDVPCLDVRDATVAAREAAAARRIGFTGKAAIHPCRSTRSTRPSPPRRRRRRRPRASWRRSAMSAAASACWTGG
jgi:citrate lyase beta subunit